MSDIPLIEVEVRQMVYGGDGLARLPDGRAVFVPFTLPGERVRVRLVEKRKNFARASLVEVLTPSPQRISPRCLHFGVCGGCQYQHMAYETQCTIKQAVFAEQITRITGLEQPPVRSIQPSQAPWNYRNTVQFHLSPAGQVGYHAAGTHHVVEIAECHLPLPGINQIWPQLEFEPDSEIERVEITEGLDEDILLALTGGELPPELALDLPISVVHLSPAGSLVLAGDDHVLLQVKERVFSVSAGSFFQVNLPLATTLVDVLVTGLQLNGSEAVLDLYSGVGLFSAFLAPLAREVAAVEQSESACNDFAVNLDEFDNVSLYQGDVGAILPALSQEPDVAVVDPPRTGLDRRVIDALLKKAPGRIAYISCDPPTLARDLKRLVDGGYHLLEMIPLDMFPQTHHIESLSFLEWRGR